MLMNQVLQSSNSTLNMCAIKLNEIIVNYIIILNSYLSSKIIMVSMYCEYR